MTNATSFERDPVRRLAYWITEREAIRVAKEAGTQRPWTKDPILQGYRFCNVRREDDKVTRWLAREWRGPHASDPLLWFAICVARLVNWPRTLAELGYPGSRWRPEGFVSGMGRALRFSTQHGQGTKVWGGAYVVSTNGNRMPKPEYVAHRVLAPLWAMRKEVTRAYRQHHTLAGFHDVLMDFDGLGSFMAAQVVADLKYAPMMRHAADWHTWAASGPGSRRGLNRALDRHPDAPWGGEAWWLVELHMLWERLRPQLPLALQDLHMQDLQNCLCEFSKWEKTRLGEGRPKARYPGVAP